MPKVKGLGTSISYLPTYDSGDAPILIGSLKSVGEISPDSEELDSTTLDSPGGFREFMQGFKDSGELPITGLHDEDKPGQALCRTLYTSGAVGYFWVRFSDATYVVFKAYVKSHTIGAADVDGMVGFAATLRISGFIQVILTKPGTPQAKTAGQTATLDATATALLGTPTYQWYSNDENNYDTPTIISGATSATYTTPALTAGVNYYFCKVTVPNYRPVESEVFVITVT